MRNKVEPITLAATTTCILLHLACSSAGPAGAEEPIAISPTTPEIGEYDTIVRTPDWWPSVGPRIASIEDRGLELWIQKDLNRDLFYIAPRVSIIVSEMESALEKALAARQSPDAIVSVAVPVNLIDDAVRNKAAVALNAQGLKDSKGNGILPSSISLYPYTYLIVFWQMNGQRVQLAYSTPLPSKSTEVPGLDALPTTVTFQASGTERDLKDLIAGAELEGVYHGGGYLIQRDAIKASFGSKMTDDLLQDLQGDAIWKSLAAYEAGQKGGSTTIPLFHNSAGQKSWTSAELLETSLVTRAQLLTVARKQVSTLQFEETLSPGSPGRLEHVREAVLNTLLRVAEEQCREYAVESWKLVVSSNLLADLSPDRIARLNASLEAHHNLNSQKEGSAEYANIQAKFQDDLALLDETDFVYDVAGERTMPKAIKLFQLNSALLSQIRSIALESTRVVGKGGGEMRFLGSFGELISPQMTKTIDKPFSVTRSEFLNRGDRDVHTKDDHATSIVVWHDEPLVSGNEVHLNVYCRVKERAGDETTLGMDDVVVMNKPADFLNFALGDTIMYGRPDSVRRNRFDPAFSDDWREELHTFRRLSLPANSLLRNVEVKPDSRGGDDTEEGRMGFRGVVRIPYYVRTEPEWRFTVRRTRQ